ncbi:hypothetical protein Pcac1_g13640 [Phytophthora cactorum]|nr:hypothetical protein Pcac1_g13640 [Phytophthora cactorum]
MSIWMEDRSSKKQWFKGGIARDRDFRRVSTRLCRANQNAQLLKNGTVIQVVYPGYYQGYYCSAILNTMEHLEENDELTITFTCNLAETSYLTFVRLGS